MKEYLLIDDGKSCGKTLNCIYFHGKIEDDIGLDFVSVIGDNLEELIKTQDTIETFVLVNNEFKQVKMFLWAASESKIRKGLVCYIDDIEFIEDATNKQRACAEYI